MKQSNEENSPYTQERSGPGAPARPSARQNRGQGGKKSKEKALESRKISVSTAVKREKKKTRQGKKTEAVAFTHQAV